MINKETRCPKCKSKKIIKRGILQTESKGKRQRYGCTKCNHRFVENEPFRRMRNHKKVITACMDMYYSGMSLRLIKEHLEKFYPDSVSHTTIYRWILKYVNVMAQYTNKLKVENVKHVSADEVEYHRRKSHHSKDGVYKNWYIDIIDVRSLFLVSGFYVKNRQTEIMRRVWQSAKKRTGESVKIVSTDGLEGYSIVLKKTFGLKKTYGRHKSTSKIFHRVIKSTSDRFNYKIERFHNTLRARTKVMRGFHGCINSAQTIMRGFEIYYNYIRKNQGLKGLTPSDVAIPNLDFTNKNRWIEIIERGHRK